MLRLPQEEISKSRFCSCGLQRLQRHQCISGCADSMRHPNSETDWRHEVSNESTDSPFPPSTGHFRIPHLANRNVISFCKSEHPTQVAVISLKTVWATPAYFAATRGRLAQELRCLP